MIISNSKTYHPSPPLISSFVITFPIFCLKFLFILSGKSTDKNELIARILLAPRLKKNDYGESIFYNQKGESMAAVFPKFGRVLLWNASIPYLYKPPAMSYLQSLYSITIKLTTDKEKMDIGAKETKVKSDNKKPCSLPIKTSARGCTESNMKPPLAATIQSIFT